MVPGYVASARPQRTEREHGLDEAVDRVRIGLGVDPQPAIARGLATSPGRSRSPTAAASGSGPTASQKFVDGRRRRERDRVDLAGAHPRRASAASGSTGTVRYTASTSTS